MAIFKNANFDERRNAAEAAKKAKLEKFRALTAQINEGAAKRQATRQEIVAARDVRAAERESARLVNEARLAEDQAAREVVQKAAKAEHDAKAASQAEREVASGQNARRPGMPVTPLASLANNDALIRVALAMGDDGASPSRRSTIEFKLCERLGQCRPHNGDRRDVSDRITGFTFGAGSTLALLPPQNATGNFAKVVQRLPVRIELRN
jgi:membrane fusion protein, multidrug efflux system